MGLSVAAPRLSKGAGKVNLKLAMASQITNPIGLRSAEAIKRIQDETGGDVQIRLFTNGQLGAEPDVLNQVRTGAVDMFNVSTVILFDRGAAVVDQRGSIRIRVLRRRVESDGRRTRRLCAFSDGARQPGRI